jgi:DNA-directed RNA polymerase subunit E'
MFYVFEVEDIVRIPPAKFKYDLKETIIDVVSDEKVGYLDNDVGVILGIIDIKEVGDASVIMGDGAAYVNTTYKALTFKPELQAVYEGTVKDVAEFGAFVDIGPFDALVHVSQIMDDFINFDGKNQCFSGKESKNTLGRDDIVIAKLLARVLKKCYSI